MTWYLVETLASMAPPTIVSKDGRRRDWTSLHRLDHDEHLDLATILSTARTTGAPATHTLNTRHTTRRIATIPVLGPTQQVHGIHLWIGPPDQPIPPHRPAAGICWHLGELHIQQTLDSWMMSTHDADGYKRIRSPGEFYRKVVRFDNISELIALGTDPRPDARFESHITVLHDDGHLMGWHVVARGVTDPDLTGMRGLTHDTTDTTPPVIGPLENLGLNTTPKPDDPAAALLAFPPGSPTPIIAQWIGPVPDWIDWQREGDPELIHHNDWPRLRRTVVLLDNRLPDSHTTTPVRIRATTPTGWQPATITSRRYPGEVGTRLHIIRITKNT